MPMNTRRLYRYLVAHIKTRLTTYLYADACVKGDHTALMPDASIENLQNKATSIVLGANTTIRGRLIVWKHNGKITIGDHCFVGSRTEIWSMSDITIGNRVLISHNVNINDSNSHSKSAVERHRHYSHIMEQGHPASAELLGDVPTKPIVIEDDVWISFGCTILKGVRIGARSIIAAGAVITHDVPCDTLCIPTQTVSFRALTPNMNNLAKIDELSRRSLINEDSLYKMSRLSHE